MRYFHLVWRNLLRRKFRTIFTIAVIFISFVLYAFLMTIRTAFSMGVEVAGVDRLSMMHKVSLIQPLPVSYLRSIETTPGVVSASHASWFGGTYQNTANAFAVIAVEPQSYLSLYPEIRVAPDQLKAWLADRQGVLIGRDLANRYGWKIGDRIPIQATIWRPKQGNTWTFNIAAIYDADAAFDKTNFFFRYDYFDENRLNGQGLVGWYIIKVNDPPRAAEIARSLDAQFANSSAETKTATEKAFLQGFVNQVGNISALVVAIVAAVLFTLFFLVTANTMAQSVRERTSELAVLKTLGFPNVTIVSVVLAETLLMAVIGGGLGIGIMWLLVSQGSFNNAFLPVFILQGRDIVLGGLLCVGLALLAGAVPAIGAVRLRIVDALRRN